jgi:hypothetical protein
MALVVVAVMEEVEVWEYLAEALMVAQEITLEVTAAATVDQVAALGPVQFTAEQFMEDLEEHLEVEVAHSLVIMEFRVVEEMEQFV